MGRNTFTGEDPEEDRIVEDRIAKIRDTYIPDEELITAAQEIDEQWGELKIRAAAGSKTAQHQLDLLMRDQEG